VKKKKQVYEIAVSWEMYGKLFIEATSLDKALEKAHADDTPLPRGHYVEASFTVDDAMVECLYPKG